MIPLWKCLRIRGDIWLTHRIAFCITYPRSSVLASAYPFALKPFDSKSVMMCSLLCFLMLMPSMFKTMVSPPPVAAASLKTPSTCDSCTGVYLDEDDGTLGAGACVCALKICDSSSMIVFIHTGTSFVQSLTARGKL